MTETEAHYYYLEIECAKRLRIIDQRDERIKELEAELAEVRGMIDEAVEELDEKKHMITPILYGCLKDILTKEKS